VVGPAAEEGGGGGARTGGQQLDGNEKKKAVRGQQLGWIPFANLLCRVPIHFAVYRLKKLGKDFLDFLYFHLVSLFLLIYYQ
jgi:hypothetical protein